MEWLEASCPVFAVALTDYYLLAVDKLRGAGGELDIQLAQFTWR